MIRDAIKLHALSLLKTPTLSGKLAAAKYLGLYADCIVTDTINYEIAESLLSTNRQKEAELKSILNLSRQDIDWPSLVPAYPERDPMLTLDPEREKSIPQTPAKEFYLNIIDGAIWDVEVNAMEIACVILILEQNLPYSFLKDYISIITDEARHAEMLASHLARYSEFQSPRTYSNRVWNKSLKGKNLIEKIMIENVIEEGYAADRTVGFINELKPKFPDFAALFESINNDEIRHAEIGNRWAMNLLQGSEEAYFSLFDRLVESVNPNAKHIDAIGVRLKSGFSKNFIKRYF